MFKLIAIGSIGLLLGGCQLLTGATSYADSSVSEQQSDAVNAHPLLVEATRTGPLALAKQGYHAPIPVLHIGDYVRNMAQDLVSNMENINPKTPVAVTHFALLDSDLMQSNLLSLQIAESLMHEFHQFRIPVIDFKSTDYIRITERGDFYLTRDHTELEPNVAIDYVITGTLLHHQGGVLVNARVLSVANQQMVASAQSIIPAAVVDALIGTQHDMVQGHNRIDVQRQ